MILMKISFDIDPKTINQSIIMVILKSLTFDLQFIHRSTFRLFA